MLNFSVRKRWQDSLLNELLRYSFLAEKLLAMPRGDKKTKDVFTVLSNARFSKASPIRSLREVGFLWHPLGAS